MPSWVSFGYLPQFRGKSFLRDLYWRVIGYPYAPRRSEAAAVMEASRARAGQRVLDLGSGEGVWQMHAARQGCRVVGVDVSTRELHRARQWGNTESMELECVTADAASLPLKSGSVDGAFSVSAFEYVAHDEQAFREVHRVLKKGSRFVVSLAPSRIPFSARLLLRLPKPLKRLLCSSAVANSSNASELRQRLDQKFRHHRTYTAESARNLAEKTGFMVLCTKPYLGVVGDFLSGLFLGLKVFEWSKESDSDYRFSSLVAHALAFPLVYPFYFLERKLCLGRQGLVIVLVK